MATDMNYLIIFEVKLHIITIQYEKKKLKGYVYKRQLFKTKSFYLFYHKEIYTYLLEIGSKRRTIKIVIIDDWCHGMLK